MEQINPLLHRERRQWKQSRNRGKIAIDQTVGCCGEKEEAETEKRQQRKHADAMTTAQPAAAVSVSPEEAERRRQQQEWRKMKKQIEGLFASLLHPSPSLSLCLSFSFALSIWAYLREAGIDVQHTTHTGQLVFKRAVEVYQREPPSALNRLSCAFKEVRLRCRWHGRDKLVLRVLHMAWACAPGSHSLLNGSLCVSFVS